MSNKKTSHTDNELITIFQQDNINEKYFPKFLAYYKKCFDDLYDDHKDFNDDDFDEDDSVQASALWCTNRYIKPYLEHIARGHSEEWAHSIADSAEDGERIVYFVYSDLMRINPELAKKELLIHTKSLGNDEHFERQYLYLFEVMDEPNGRIQTALNYSKIYKEQIEKGKTAVYSHQFADLMSDGHYNEIYCEEYAFAYDEAVNKNKSEEYISVYSDKYASVLVDIKRRHGISDDEEMIDFAIEKVKAYMNAWEYGKENKLKDFKRFAEIYEHTHLNTYFADAGWPEESREKMDSMILEKTLEKFNKN
ncbi:hypothetical protein [Flavobacterium terrigena]|uniref:Uncharacterized protein n=1 Tax=Flavobacterium terrigena TaxID=402734 RepID=A0A1H6QG33_9FLAO|nr:hypothetical protein [Flavobacterium terrigena]SEI42691.1 hypothetical protein SAMN05660918_0503 [Flavobacterium terrigena]